MFTVRRLAVVLVSCALTLLFLGLFSLSEDAKDKKDDESLTLVAASYGLETTAHEKFVNELKRGTKLEQNSTVRIFLGPYFDLFGFDGFLLAPAPPNYYIFIDVYFYLSLNQKEAEALIAHELGHAIYERSFVDKLEFRILSKLNTFFNTFGQYRRYEIITKYQIKADRFSAEKTSLTATVSFLNKLYLNRTDGNRRNWDS